MVLKGLKTMRNLFINVLILVQVQQICLVLLTAQKIISTNFSDNPVCQSIG